ncbi:hypothetical protein HD554DRAFT_2206979 [Boletus coccyginus]|nr:hypothetical protein HD554DRAFT_2206979 [Boletus coccyginus]
MQGINQKSNALQSIIGFFLQSVHTPYKVIDTLAYISVSISMDAINMAVQSLSLESNCTLQSLGHSLVVSYTYDNFEVDLKSQVPTIKKSNTLLKHLTSELLFPLAHRVVPDDLQYSNELWKKSLLNPEVEKQNTHTWWDLISLHKYFHQFKSKIMHPEPIEPIPLVKKPIFAAQSMDINNSTVSKNIWAIVELLKQGEIYEPAQTPSGEETNDYMAGWDSPDIHIATYGPCTWWPWYR